jgi:hypothetical protein
MLIVDFASITNQQALVPSMESILTTISNRIYDPVDMGMDGITTAHRAREKLQEDFNKLITSKETITWLKIESLAQKHLMAARIYSAPTPAEATIAPAYPGAPATQGFQAHAMYELVPNAADAGRSSGGVATAQPYMTPRKSSALTDHSQGKGGKGGKGSKGKGKGSKGSKGKRRRGKDGKGGKGGKGKGGRGRGGRGDDTPETALAANEDEQGGRTPLKYPNVTCFKCGGVGHYAHECPSERTEGADEGSPNKKGRVANAADSEGAQAVPWYNTYHFE